MSIPTLRDGPVTIRPIRLRDSRTLEQELMSNRGWLRALVWPVSPTHEPLLPLTSLSFGHGPSITDLPSRPASSPVNIQPAG